MGSSSRYCRKWSMAWGAWPPNTCLFAKNRAYFDDDEIFFTFKLHASYSKNKDDNAKAQDALAKCKRYEFLFKCSEEAFEKAEKYYNHCDKAAAYYLAIVLDPRDKMNWFHQQWDKYPTTKATWIPGVRKQVLQVWDEEYYQVLSAAPPTRSGDDDEPSPCKISSSSKYARFFANRHVFGGQAPQAIDHFRQYLDEDPIAAEKDFDVIDYWMKRRVTQPLTSFWAF
ncbi:uncharacterized protein CPUR_06840 [Claviceps purpurea 20.1]|uniref:Uncharacterized protein n=1 Tax=Claviceps purpurea (strain 20.1) TaxID=1111077 RepID=M1WIZ5_CLAP2|nr:uncharacterized protein CPUR_06840 [Claviceps purpurea 20.1]